MTEVVRDNVDRSRFELAVGGEVAFATYRREVGQLLISHVYAPPVLRGTGAADRLMAGVVARARAGGERIVPHCGYARAWLRRHPAHHDLLA
ncbi:GNAT family N-acetyltransferase [Methylobacterium sp. PvR107]|uniref:GNAT family N-acetyltransferase n=1 Tax=Methylobacterium sp. PvR107 TaxID=2806597 RepID=UPI001AEAF015|nr:GNAT family N-acetyltransferase [Methylobacterium sp. PvR107]MBP1180483.1 putative GNAT family acetyltransferase [Methylobacterium sp. PvR107]